jgi:hypothetical protein
MTNRKRIVYLQNSEENLYSLFEALEAMVRIVKVLSAEHSSYIKDSIDEPLLLAEKALQAVRISARIEHHDQTT